MKLAIPIQANDKLYTNIEIIKPRSGVISDANKEKEVNPYSAMKVLISGCITSFSTNDNEIIEDKNTIRKLSNQLPYKTAEQIIFEIFKISNNDTGVEGIYPCPRCGHKIISEFNERNEIDTRDFVEDLTINYLEDYEKCILIELTEPVIIMNRIDNKPVEEPINSISLHWPTLRDCMLAYQLIGISNEAELQLAIYCQALEKVNGKEIDLKYKSRFGMYIFKNIPDPADLRKIGEEISYYGVDNRIEKHCPGCGKNWKVNINTSHFFADALQ